MAQTRESFVNGSVLKSMLRFAYPVFLANLLSTLYSTVDLFIVGKYASTADISGVSVGSMVIGIIVMGMIGFSSAVTVIMGHRTGANDERGLSKATGAAIMLYIVLAVVVTVPMIVFKNGLISLMNTPPESVTQSGQYLFFCALGLPFVVGYNLTSSILRGIGNSKAPFVFVAISTVTNIILDYVLIKIFVMGAMGAAIATAFSQAVSFFSSVIYLKHKGLGYPLKRSDVRFHREQIRELFKIGIPLCSQDLLVHLSFIVITAVVNKMGLAVSAAAGITERVITILFMPASSLCTAIATVTAHNIGAKKYDRAKKCMWLGIIICTGIGILDHLASVLFGEEILSLFANDPEVIRHALLYLSTYAIDCMCIGFLFPINGYLTSAGHSVFTMIHTVTTAVCIRMGLTVVLAGFPTTTLKEIGIASPLSSTVSIIMSLIFLLYLKKHPAKAIRVSENG